MNKNYINLILIIIIVIIFGTTIYIAWNKNSSVSFPESEVIAVLKANWQSIQTLIPFRPSYANKVENQKAVWQSPYIVQFIGKGNILTEVEDDYKTNVIIFHFNGNKFTLLQSFKNQWNFTLSDYNNLVSQYGDVSYNASTYTIGLVRDKKTIMFQDLTKVPENIFVKGYSIKNNS